MNAHTAPSLPTTIPAYLDQLRAALTGADSALVHDALYDAEEYLRSELAENPRKSESEVIASVAGSYGAPAEVAAIYRDTEVTVQTALRAPPPKPRVSLAGRFFGVIADPRTYAALFYCVLALATGIFYFTWVVTGLSLSAGLAVLIIGVPFVILYFGSVRGLSLVEGRIIEVMLGERMPRRPLYNARGKPLLERIGAMFTDPRTWSTQLYFLLMLPLGIFYFTLMVTGLSVSLSLIAAPLVQFFVSPDVIHLEGWGLSVQQNPWLWPVVMATGVLLLFATLHIARFIGRMHGQFAKHLLVKSSQYD
ncbi:MAG: sensor domain-containing protein [Luteimonas sp.]